MRVLIGMTGISNQVVGVLLALHLPAPCIRIISIGAGAAATLNIQSTLHSSPAGARFWFALPVAAQQEFRIELTAPDSPGSPDHKRRETSKRRLYTASRVSLDVVAPNGFP